MSVNILKSNKITGLEKLRDMGFNVPKFDFIPDFETLNLTLIDLNPNYPPKHFRQMLTEKLAGFDIVSSGVSVRSASFDEDNSSQTAAGRYLTFNGLVSIQEAIEACFAIWRHHRENSHNTKCPLIVQMTHPSYYSGVCFKDRETLIIESYYGACQNLVEGRVRPYATIIKNNEAQHIPLAENNYSYHFAAHSDLFKESTEQIGKVLKPKKDSFVRDCRLFSVINAKTFLVYGYRPSFPIDTYESIVTQIIDIAAKLDSEYGVDIEWGSDKNGNVFVYQYRALSRKIDDLNINMSIPSLNSQNNETSEGTVYGIPASKGTAVGKIVYNVADIGEDSILFLESDYLEDAAVLDKVKGVISAQGGILSHLSIMCREKNIPSVIGINQALPQGAMVSMDGATGTITLV